MSRCFSSHLEPIPVSTSTRRLPSLISRQRRASSTRFRSSTGCRFCQSGLGTMPNIAPPSKAMLPSRTSWSSNLPKHSAMASPAYRLPPYLPTAVHLLAPKILGDRGGSELLHRSLGRESPSRLEGLKTGREIEGSSRRKKRQAVLEQAEVIALDVE